jgi:hypothetical protein
MCKEINQMGNDKTGFSKFESWKNFFFNYIRESYKQRGEVNYATKEITLCEKNIQYWYNFYCPESLKKSDKQTLARFLVRVNICAAIGTMVTNYVALCGSDMRLAPFATMLLNHVIYTMLMYFHQV